MVLAARFIPAGSCFLRVFFKFINRVNRLASLMAGGLTVVMGVVVCYAVVARYLFNKPVGWSEEISTYLMMWGAFLGAAYTMQTDGHIGVDIICRKLSPRAQYWLNVAKYLTGIAFLLVLTVKGYEDCALSYQLNQVSIGELAVPMYIPQLALPLGSALLTLQILEKLVRQIMGRDWENEQ